MVGRNVGGPVGPLAWLMLLIAIAGLAAPAAADITYIYDELGRLRAVIDLSQPDGTAIYSCCAALSSRPVQLSS
jgi:hypothetical protein